MAARAGDRHADTIWNALVPAALAVVPAALAVLVDSGFLFMSLGPIIYEVVERPLVPASSPRNTIIANAVALAVGYLALVALGLRDEPSTLVAGVTTVRAMAVVVAIAVTGAALAWFDAMHPPAGATMLLVSLGLVRDLTTIGVIFAGVVIVSALAYVLNRAAGIPVPVWRAPSPT